MRYARLCIIVSVIWVLLIACSEGVTEAPRDSASSESDDQKKVAVTTNDVTLYFDQKRQADIFMFYVRVLGATSPSDMALSDWKRLSGLYANNQIDHYDYYKALLVFKDAHHRLADIVSTWRLDMTPDGLEDAELNLWGMLQNRGDAMDHYAKAVNTGDLEELRKAEQDMEEANGMAARSIVGILNAAMDAGIDLDALDYVVHCDEETRSCGVREPKPGQPLLVGE